MNGLEQRYNSLPPKPVARNLLSVVDHIKNVVTRSTRWLRQGSDKRRDRDGLPVEYRPALERVDQNSAGTLVTYA